MINETASSMDNRPALRSSVRVPSTSSDNMRYSELRDLISNVFLIQEENFEPDLPTLIRDGVLLLNPEARAIATFTGRLLVDSEAAYERLDALMKPLNYVPVFRAAADGKQIIHVLSGRVSPKPRSWWINAVLFVLTVFSVLILGTTLAINEIYATSELRAAELMNNFFLELWRGLPYAISILLILGSHELGHYFAARRHNIAVTLPYFIPAPFISFLGTFGAFIQIREPMRNRKVLLDVGAAGPLAGLIFAIPILLIGLATSPVKIIEPGGALEGNSILYALAKFVVFGRFLPDGQYDVYINQLAMAGWAGLLVTALNLIPLGQLDGGHILYSLIGDHARKLYYPLLALSIILAYGNQAWILWIVLLLVFGRTYAAPLDMITPLDPRRRIIAAFSLLLFAVLFVPNPISEANPGVMPPDLRDTVYIAPMLTAAVVLVFQRLRR